jgi:hypothetical protein
MSQISWSEWHRLYADPNSRLSLRLRAVQTRIQEALDDCPAGDIRVVSLCAGQGQDLLGVLQHHVRRDDVLARLVELDEHNVAIARTTAQATALPRVEIVAGDASQIDLYVGTLPADLVLVCGVFGNISDADIARTIAYMPQLCAPGATVVWTRHLAPPDLTPAIRQWFIDAEFKELGFETVANTFGVGASRFAGGPAELEPGVRLFNFIGYDRLRSLTAMSNTLYALCGLPFAGKSSVARKLATRTGAVLVSLDAINGEYDVGLDGQLFQSTNGSARTRKRIGVSLSSWCTASRSSSITATSAEPNATRYGRLPRKRVLGSSSSTCRWHRLKLGGGCWPIVRHASATCVTTISSSRYRCSSRPMQKST